MVSRRILTGSQREVRHLRCVGEGLEIFCLLTRAEEREGRVISKPPPALFYLAILVAIGVRIGRG